MSKDSDNFSFEDDAHDANSGAEELRQQIIEIQKKLTGENSEPVTNIEVLQFLRVINYNFISLTQMLQAILLKTTEMDTALMNLELSGAHLNNRLQQFFETNSMLDDIIDGDLNASGSAPDDKSIL